MRIVHFSSVVLFGCDIDSFDELHRINRGNRQKRSNNERDLDPWF